MRFPLALSCLATLPLLAPSVVLAQRATQPAAPPGAPALYWTADGTPADATGHHPLLLSGVTYVPGIAGQAFHFDGATRYAHLPFDELINVPPDGQFTLAVWVNLDRVGTYQAVVLKVHFPEVWEWGLLIHADNRVYVGHDAYDVAPSTTVLQPHRWYHLAVTYDAGTYRTYVDGREEARVENGSRITPSTGGLSVGRKGEAPLPGDPRDDPDWFAGAMDEIRFFRRALSPGEIARLYQSVLRPEIAPPFRPLKTSS